MIQTTTPVGQTATPKAHSSKTGGLRELGVYGLPDGSEYVASALYFEGRGLYPLPAWGLFAGAELRVDAEGRLLRRGSPTRWNVSDLRDTGRTARYPATVIA